MRQSCYLLIIKINVNIYKLYKKNNNLEKIRHKIETINKKYK